MKRRIRQIYAVLLSGMMLTTSCQTGVLAEELTDGSTSLEYEMEEESSYIDEIVEEPVMIDSEEPETFPVEDAYVLDSENEEVSVTEEFAETTDDTEEILLDDGGVDAALVGNEDLNLKDSGTCGENLTWELTNDGILTISGTGDIYDYYCDNMPWYQYISSGITSVIIGEGVTSIGDSAFAYCSNIESIVLPEGLTSIGEDAFYNCSNIESIVLPEGLEVIGESAFDCCSNIEIIILPEGLEVIGDYAFAYCSNLKSLTIPSSLGSTSYDSFYKCSSLKDVYYTGDWLTFEGFMEHCYIDFGSASIHCKAATGECGSNVSWQLTEDRVLIISGTGNMTNYDEWDPVPTWFDAEKYINSVVIKKGVTSIGDYAFYDCDGITSITIPNSVTSIGAGTFSDCDGITSITIPNSVTSIFVGAFSDCRGLKKVVIPDGVEWISNHAFSGCSSLQSISIPNSVTYMGDSVFLGCSSLQSISIPDSVTYIAANAFENCSSLQNVAIPNSVTWISNSVFSDCSSLKSISIPNSITYIGEEAFMNCSSLKTAKLSTGMTEIYESTFSGCSSLTSIVIPSSVTKIGQNAFYNCSSLTSVTLSSALTTIGVSSFYGCSSLTSVNFPSKVKTVGNHAFRNCTKLNKVGMPVSVSNIKSYAFSGCTALTDVYYSGTASNWSTITIASGNDPLTSAARHYSSSMPLDTPKLNTPSLTTTGVKVSWGRVSGAEKYRLYYKVSGASSWTKVTDTTATSYTVTGLTSGKTYVFTVRCVNVAGTVSTSSFDSAGKSIKYIAAPVISTLVLTKSGVKVSWGSVSGAEKYRVFYKISGSSSWSKAGDTTNTSYTVNGLTSGKTYVFTVRCVNAEGTSFTSANDATGKTQRFVKAPVLSGVSNAAAGVTVKWEASAGASNYRVFYKQSGASSWSKAGDTTSTSYTVKNLTSGKSYVFTVRCLNTAGSSFTSAFDSTGKTLLYLSRPTVSAAQASKGVKVTWSKVAGAGGYYVYRKVSGGSWKQIKTISSGSTVSYTDTTGESGTKYFYTVKAYKGSTVSAHNAAGASATAK